MSKPRGRVAKAVLDAAAQHLPHGEIGRALIELGTGVLAGDGLSDAEVMSVVRAALGDLHAEHPERRPAKGAPS